MGVYFIQLGDKGPIKIGYSANVYKRIMAIRQAHVEPIWILRTYHDWDRDIEQSLHKMFAPYRIKGEWYRPEKEIYGLIGLPPGHLPCGQAILKLLTVSGDKMKFLPGGICEYTD